MFIGEEWSHKEDYRQRYPLSGVRSWGYKCQVSLHHFTVSYCSNLLLYYLIYCLIISFLYSTTYITCPADPKKTLGIKLPFLIMIIKNLRKYFTFEVQVGHTYRDPYSYIGIFKYTRGAGFHLKNIKSLNALMVLSRSLKPFLYCDNFQVLDDKNVRRRFRASNYQSTTRVKPFICTMPMRLDDGWNQIQFNLSDFTRRAYGTNYIETLRVQVGGGRPLLSRPSPWTSPASPSLSFLPFPLRFMQTVE